MLASSRKTSLMASANRSSTRFETRVHAPALCLPRGRRLVVTSGHCAGTYLIPFYLEGVSTMIVCVTCSVLERSSWRGKENARLDMGNAAIAVASRRRGLTSGARPVSQSVTSQSFRGTSRPADRPAHSTPLTLTHHRPGPAHRLAVKLAVR